MAHSAACPARGAALDPPCSYRLRSVGSASAAPHVGRHINARQSCSRSGLPQRQARGIRSTVGLRQILGLLVTPVGTRQTGWPAREYAPCRQSQCPPGRSAADIRPAPRRTDDAARPACTRPVRKPQVRRPPHFQAFSQGAGELTGWRPSGVPLGRETLETRGRDCLIPGLPPFPLSPPPRSRTPAGYRRLCRCGRLHSISVALHRGRHSRAGYKAGFAKSPFVTRSGLFPPCHSPSANSSTACRRAQGAFAA